MKKSFFTSGEISQIVKGKLLGKSDIPFKGKFKINSKEIEEGDIFIPLKGRRRDGHEFIGEALKKGAVGFLFEKRKRAFIEREILPQINKKFFAIEVENTYESLKAIAQHKRKLFQGKIIAITGTAGKTTTKEFISFVLSHFLKVYKTTGNLNSQIGLPLTLANADLTADIWVLELGADTLGGIKKLTQLAQHHIAVITSIGRAHLRGFKSLENILKEKLEILNSPNLEGAVIPQNIKKEALSLIYSKPSIPLLTVQGSWSYKFTKEGKTIVEIPWKGKTSIVIIPLFGSVAYLTELVFKVCSLFLSPEKFLSIMEKFRGFPHRMQPIFRGDYLIIDDSYNANPLSMRDMLTQFSKLKRFYKELVVILGDMLDLGAFEKEEHEKLAYYLEEGNFSEIYLYGPAMFYTYRKLKEISSIKKIHWSEDKEFLKKLFRKRHPQKGTAYLIKGSRSMKMEEFLW